MIRHWARTLGSILAVALLAGAIHLLVRDRPFEAEARLLIDPVPASEGEVINVGLLEETGELARTLQTAAALVTTPAVAEAAGELVGLPDAEPSTLLDQVSAKPVAGTSLVAIRARAPEPLDAAGLADGFADATLATRSQTIRDRAREEVERLRAAPRDEATRERIRTLRRLAPGPVPDMSIAARATVPDQPSGPTAGVVLAVAAGIGLLAGLTAIAAMRLLDPRLRDAELLRDRFGLPVLARVPIPADDGDGALDPSDGATIESLRALGSALPQPNGAGGTAVLMTSAAAAEGKTTTAWNAAATLARAGRRVIVVDADLRLPRLAELAGLEPERGIVDALLEQSSLTEALAEVPGHGGNLHLLAAERSGPWLPELLGLSRAAELLAEARSLADVVVLDAPPLGEVADALPLAELVDGVLIVARLGASRLDRIERTLEQLGRRGVEPAGFVVIGEPRREHAYYHQHANGAGGPGGGSPRPSDERGDASRLDLDGATAYEGESSLR